MFWGKLYIGISCSRLLRISSGCSYKILNLAFVVLQFWYQSQVEEWQSIIHTFISSRIIVLIIITPVETMLQYFHKKGLKRVFYKISVQQNLSTNQS